MTVTLVPPGCGRWSPLALRWDERRRGELPLPVGIKRGGVINLVRHEIEFLCSPDHIPQSIEVDLTGLDIGGSIHISSVKLPEGATPTIRERDFTLVTIGAPSGMKADAEATPAAGAAAAGCADCVGGCSNTERPFFHQ